MCEPDQNHNWLTLRTSLSSMLNDSSGACSKSGTREPVKIQVSALIFFSASHARLATWLKSNSWGGQVNEGPLNLNGRNCRSAHVKQIKTWSAGIIHLVIFWGRNYTCRIRKIWRNIREIDRFVTILSSFLSPSAWKHNMKNEKPNVGLGVILTGYG